MNYLEAKDASIPSYEAHLFAMQLAAMCDKEERVTIYCLAADLLRETEEGLRGKTRKGEDALSEAYRSLLDLISISNSLLEGLSRNKGVQLCGRGSLSKKIDYFNKYKGRRAKSDDLKLLLRTNWSAEVWVQKAHYYPALFCGKNYTGRRRPTLTCFVDEVREKGTHVQREMERKLRYQERWES